MFAQKNGHLHTSRGFTLIELLCRHRDHRLDLVPGLC